MLFGFDIEGFNKDTLLPVCFSLCFWSVFTGSSKHFFCCRTGNVANKNGSPEQLNKVWPDHACLRFQALIQLRCWFICVLLSWRIFRELLRIHKEDFQELHKRILAGRWRQLRCSHVSWGLVPECKKEIYLNKVTLFTGVCELEKKKKKYRSPYGASRYFLASILGAVTYLVGLYISFIFSLTATKNAELVPRFFNEKRKRNLLAGQHHLLVLFSLKLYKVGTSICAKSRSRKQGGWLSLSTANKRTVPFTYFR